MSKKIIFGNDLAKELKKYGLNKIAEVPTKYKNGITTIYYMYSVVSNIDKLTIKTPYIEYTTDEETDGFIMGVMFPQGQEGINIEFDSFEDVKYFISHAEYSKTDLTESIKERSYEDEILIDGITDNVEYYCNLYEEIGKLSKTQLKDLKENIERLQAFNCIDSIYQWGVEVLNKCGVKYNGLKESKKSLKEGKNAKKSLEIIRRKLMELINDDTIQEEFTYAFDIGGSTFDSVNDLFETSVHNVLHELLEENTVEIIPF